MGLPYCDTRGMYGSHSYRLPRKMKKQWRKQIEENLRAIFIPRQMRVLLRWQPLHGWTLTSRPKQFWLKRRVE